MFGEVVLKVCHRFPRLGLDSHVAQKFAQPVHACSLFDGRSGWQQTAWYNRLVLGKWHT